MVYATICGSRFARAKQAARKASTYNTWQKTCSEVAQTLGMSRIN